MKKYFETFKMIVEEKQKMESLLKEVEKLDANESKLRMENENHIIDLGKLSIDLEKLLEVLPTKSPSEFKDPLNYINNRIKQGSITDGDKPTIERLSHIAYNVGLEAQSSCFICESKNSIYAHSIQENGELSLIASQVKTSKEVYGLAKDKTHTLNIFKKISINVASTFLGMCQTHDNIFKPIDTDPNTSQVEYRFLLTVRAFAYFYFNKKANQDYDIKIFNSIYNKGAFDKFANFIGNRGEKFDIDSLHENSKLINIENPSYKVERFEAHRSIILNALQEKYLPIFDYLYYEFNHLCPLVCASCTVQTIIINGLHNKPNNGFPFVINVLPNKQKNKTYLLLSWFKTDNVTIPILANYSKMFFNKDFAKFEIEISRMIVMNSVNYYLSPDFYENLNESELSILNNSINLQRHNLSNDFNCLNFFDEKYKITVNG